MSSAIKQKQSKLLRLSDWYPALASRRPLSAFDGPRFIEKILQLDARRLEVHRHFDEAEHQRITLAEHRPLRGQQAPRPDPHPEENAILTAAPELA
jgi:hypothetical protein